MSAINTNNLINLFAKTFIDSVGVTHYVYYFIGYQTPIPGTTVTGGGTTIPPPVDTVTSYYNVWDNMIAAKLVTQNDISLVINNITWASNTIYTGYTDTNATLFTSPFYVITSNNEVYKCLSNNNGSISTVQPIGFGTLANNYTQTTSDGYLWKYMLNIQPGDVFFNSAWIPIPMIAPPNSAQALIQEAAVPGSIDFINVSSGGSGFGPDNPEAYIITITGNGSGANAYANISNGSVQNIIMAAGMNYTFADVYFNGSGTGANGTAIISPPGGTGSHTDQELGANAVMFVLTTSTTESGYFSVASSFRQNGLIIDMQEYNSNTISTQAYVNTCTQLIMTAGINNYVSGEICYQGNSPTTGTFSSFVIDFNPTTNVLRINNLEGVIDPNSVLYGSQSATQRYITSVVEPDVQIYTGILENLNNLTGAVYRNANQTETSKFILQF